MGVHGGGAAAAADMQEINHAMKPRRRWVGVRANPSNKSAPRSIFLSFALGASLPGRGFFTIFLHSRTSIEPQ